MTEELVKKGLEVLENSAKLFTTESSKVLAEYINLLMAFAVLDLIRTFLIIGAVFIAIRKINVVIQAEKETTKDDSVLTGLRGIKVALAIFVSGYAIVGGMNCVKEIVKISVAPRVYLIEKGVNLVKPELAKEK